MVVKTIKKGYKQTEVGIIPEEWDIKPFKEISTMNGRIGWQGLKQSEFTQNPNDPFLITGMNFKDAQIRWDEVYHIKLKRYEEAKPIQLKPNDVLITKDGTIGKLLFVDEIPYPGKASLNSHLLVLRPINEQYDPKFLFYQLLSKPFLEYVERNKHGTTFFGITQNAIGNYDVYLPKKLEQQKIALILSDTDKLIKQLENLITKKKNIKQGAMQELLTGKRRLSGFDDEWETKKLGDIAEAIKGKGLSKSKILSDGKYKCILYGELFTTYSTIIKNVVSETNHFEGTLSRKNDILMPGSTTTVGIDLAIASVLLDDKILLGGDINIIRAKKQSYNSVFLANYLTNVVKNKIADMAQGITIIHVYGRNLKELEITIPKDLEEQAAIAQILTDMDGEIEEIEKRRNKYLMLKKGMMQKLLTGEIRLK